MLTVCQVIRAQRRILFRQWDPTGKYNSEIYNYLLHPLSLSRGGRGLGYFWYNHFLYLQLRKRKIIIFQLPCTIFSC